MLTLLLGSLLIYLLVRTAVRHGVSDAEALRLSQDRYEAFQRALDDGGLLSLVAPDDSALK